MIPAIVKVQRIVYVFEGHIRKQVDGRFKDKKP
ncbi:hypothetical protein SDC9_210097 [bioreactor metagenome]|uniref:Uncharacterized protein n=1 Tax=bioreactor metagenome TaxID=1076179 RepID=A0A645JGV9_9ZZZZ